MHDVPGHGCAIFRTGRDASQSGLITINHAYQKYIKLQGTEKRKKISNYGFTDASTAVDINILQAIISLRFTDSICRKRVPPLFSFIPVATCSDASTGYLPTHIGPFPNLSILRVPSPARIIPYIGSVLTPWEGRALFGRALDSSAEVRRNAGPKKKICKG